MRMPLFAGHFAPLCTSSCTSVVRLHRLERAHAPLWDGAACALRGCDADSGGTHYGDKVDLLATYAVNSNLSLSAKYADYNADKFSVDTQKTWAYLEYRL
ncbi:MAG TPA: hypothetical protein VHE37_04040 [Nevskiaceae bacterium]|nr:hypothetical protein [Nevskiaceae bacterium]